jgi:hypothetical protein
MHHSPTWSHRMEPAQGRRTNRKRSATVEGVRRCKLVAIHWNIPSTGVFACKYFNGHTGACNPSNRNQPTYPYHPLFKQNALRVLTINLHLVHVARGAKQSWLLCDHQTTPAPQQGHTRSHVVDQDDHHKGARNHIRSSSQ